MRDLDADVAGTRSSRRAASSRDADRARRPTIALASERMICLLGDGDHPAQQRGRQRSRRSSTSRCCAGNIGRPGAGRLPGARAQQRAGRPHDGHLGEDAPTAFLDALRRGVRLRRRRATHGLDTVDDDPGDARRAGEGASSALGGNFLVGHARHATYTAEALRALPASPCRSSTKLNRAHLITGRAGADPAVPRPHRARRAGGGRAVRHRRGLDGRRAPVARRAARRPREHLLQRAGDRRPAWRRRRWAAGTTVDWQALVDDYDRIRDHIEHVVPGFDDFNERVREPGGFYLPNAPRDGGASRRRPGEAQLHRAPDPAARARATAGCC